MSQPPRSGPAPRRSARPKLRNQLLFVLGIFLLAGGAFYTALVVATQIESIFFPDTQIRLPGILARAPGVDKGTDDGLSGGRINILVMGLDRRPSEGQAPARTDTMFVLTVDPSTRTARGLAMPRDLYVEIPTKSGGSYTERINTAFITGELNGYPGGGAALAEETVERLLGIKINYYVLIDFEGFKEVIDLLGGIDVDVPSPGVNDPYYSETELLGDFYPCVFEPGLHHMDGSDALCFARVRRNSSDLDRIVRQQRVIYAVMDKAAQLKVLADPSNAVSLYKRYKDTVVTNINEFQILGFAKLAAAIDKDRLAFLSLGAATTPYTTAQGAAVLLPSEAGIKMIVDAFLSDNRLLNEAATVEVQNGSGIEGQASKALDYFTSLGIPKTSLLAVNAAAPHPRTEIINFSDKTYTAQQLASWMSVPKDRIRKATAEDAALRQSESDIVVILGSDAQLESVVASQSR